MDITKLISDKPEGSRDVYWCHIGNEPIIIEYRNDKPFCQHCDWLGFPFNEHTFMFHILKPKLRP